MHLKTSQWVWLAVHSFLSLLACAWVYESLDLEKFPVDEFSFKRIGLAAWYATLVLAPLTTLFVWLRIASANERYATYVTQTGATFEVSLSQDASELSTFKHVIRPPISWWAVAALLPVFTKTILATTVYVMTIRRIHRVAWTIGVKTAVGAFVTLCYFALLVTFASIYYFCYKRTYDDYHRKIRDVRLEILFPQKQAPYKRHTHSDAHANAHVDAESDHHSRPPGGPDMGSVG